MRQDPTYLRTDHEVLGRDGCRVPMPWTADGPSLGFGPSGTPWLPQPESYKALAVDQQVGVPGSTLEMYRAALRLRREHGLGLGEVVFDDSFGDERWRCATARCSWSRTSAPTRSRSPRAPRCC